MSTAAPLPSEDKARFDALVARLEGFARERPAAYRRRVVALALLGHAYVWGILLLFVGMLAAALIGGIEQGGGLAVVFFVWISFGVIWFLYRVLTFRFRAPPGVRLRPGEAPALEALIADLRRRLGAPRVHRILVTRDLNAGVLQTPRFGLLGGWRNSLYLGLPLLDGCREEDVAAALAHELGHLTGGHGRIGSWIYQKRVRFAVLTQALVASQHWAAVLFVPFFRWFTPRFAAWSFVLARRHEVEADAHSAAVYGADAEGAAQVAVAVKDLWLRQAVWPEVMAQAATHAEPPEGVFAGIGARLRAPLDGAAGQRLLEQALLTWTRAEDTHPSLQDRLLALGVQGRPPLPGAVAVSAAERLLPEAVRERLHREVEAGWRAEVAAEWTARHEREAEERRLLAELDGVEAHGRLPDHERRQRAALTARHGEAAAAVRLLEAEAAADPDNAGLQLELARLRLKAGQADAAVADLEAVMALGEEHVPAAAALLAEVHLQRGDRAAAEAALRRAEQVAGLLEDAEHERATVDARADRFVAHALETERLRRLVAQLSGLGDVEAAYLVRKVVARFPERPCHVLGVVGAFEGRALFPGRAARRLLERLQAEVQLPPGTQVVLLDSTQFHLRRRLEQVPEARILSGDPSLGF